MTTYSIDPGDSFPVSLSTDDIIVFKTGIHTNIDSAEIDADGVEVLFESGAIITKMQTLASGWESTAVSNVWRYPNFSRTFAAKPFSYDVGDTHRWDGRHNLSLFSDDSGVRSTYKPIRTITDLSTTIADLEAGEWYIDEDAGGANIHDLYVYSTVDPDSLDAVLVTGDAQQAFLVTGNNVTFQGSLVSNGSRLVVNSFVEGYSNNWQAGAIRVEGTGFTMKWVTPRYNHGTGVKGSIKGHGITLNGVDLTLNGQIGAVISSNNHPVYGLLTGVLVINCELSLNNYNWFSGDGEAGGVKLTHTRDAVLANNWVHENFERGLSPDISNVNTWIIRNIVNENHGPGICVETSFGAKIISNELRDNGLRAKSTWPWGGNILLQNSSYCVVTNNRIAITQTGLAGYGQPDGLAMIQQSRGNSAITTGTLAGNEFLCLYNRVHHNRVCVGVTHSGGVTALNMQADYSAANFIDPAYNFIDYNEYHTLSAVTNTQFAIDTSVNGSDLSDITSSGFEVNGSETKHADTSTFPTDWDQIPTDEWSLTGGRHNDISVKERIETYLPLIRYYHLDEASGAIVDYSPWSANATAIAVTYGVAGIGDGYDAMRFDDISNSRVDFWNSGLDSGEQMDPNEHSLLMRIKPTAGSWTNSVQQTFTRLGDTFGAGYISFYMRQASTNNEIRFAVNRNGTTVAQSYTTEQFTDFRLCGFRVSAILNDNMALSVDENDWYETDPVAFPAFGTFDFGNDRAMIGAYNTTSENVDADIADYILCEGYIPDVIRGWIVDYNEAPHFTVSDQNDYEGATISISFTPTDNNPADTVTMSATGLPDNVSMNSSGVLSGTPTVPGTFYPIITGNDGLLSTIKTLTWIVVENTPLLSIVPQNLQQFTVGDNTSFDLDNLILFEGESGGSWSTQSGTHPSGISRSGSIVTVQPDTEESQTVVYRFTNGTGLTADATFNYVISSSEESESSGIRLSLESITRSDLIKPAVLSEVIKQYIIKDSE